MSFFLFIWYFVYLIGKLLHCNIKILVENVDVLCYILHMETTGFVEISKSKFFSYGFDVDTVQQFNDILGKLKQEHKKATHFCYAYVIEDNGNKEKCTDDKEPKGTAGIPIMNVLKRKGLKNYAIIVVRYFGGTKLGAGGLLRAYSKSASVLFNKQ